MKNKKNKSERRRVSAQDVRSNAASGGGGRNFFKLPQGVSIWEPEKATSYEMNILPYEVKSDKHPDNVEPGTIWYKLPFSVHKNVGADNKAYVCPASVGKKCPICEEKAALAKDYDKNEDAIKALNAQKWVAYNIANPDDDEKVAVFAYSRGKFAGPLDTELEQVPDEMLTFYDVKDGKTIKVRFSDDTYQGANFLTATRFDFTDRKDMDEDETLGSTVCLEEALNVLPYDKLKSIFLQEEPEKDDAKDDEPSGKKTDKSKTTKGGSDDDEKDEPDDEPETKFKVGAWVKFDDADDEPQVGKVVEIDDDDAVVEVDGERHDVDVEDLEAAKPPKGADKEDKKPEKPSKPVKSKYKFKVGDTVKDDDDNEGICKSIDEKNGDVQIKTKSGIILVDADDVELVKAVGADDDDEDEKDDEKDDEIEVGDEVTWDDGDESGEVVKILADKGIAKVVDEDGNTVKVDLDKLTKKEDD